MTLPYAVTAISAVVVGITTHLVYFVQGEHHLYGTTYLQIIAATVPATICIIFRTHQSSIGDAMTEATFLLGCYLLGLYSSLLIYRLLFHPLKNFPGPVGNKLGNLWFSFQLGNGDAYKKVFRLHEKYGDFVRVGSSDLSIVHPKAMAVIYGTGTKCGRAAFYNSDPVPSLIQTRDKKAHDARRRIWSPAFSDKALQGYSRRIESYDDQLIARIDAAATSGESMNMSKWFHYYSFDAMGDLAFGKPFDMLKNDEEHWVITIMNTGLVAVGFLFPPWLFRVLVAIPGLMRDHERITEFCNDQLGKRMKVYDIPLHIIYHHTDAKQANNETPDIMSTLLKPFPDEPPTGDDLLMLQGDSRLIVIAGRCVEWTVSLFSSYGS
jgi:tryprostatin B 6-hydroxylase